MIVGEKVVCVDDEFRPIVRAFYDELPVKDKIYTIRSVSIGLGDFDSHKLENGGTEMRGFETVALLLNELHNDIDKRTPSKEELKFNSERFRPLEEKTEEEILNMVVPADSPNKIYREQSIRERDLVPAQ